MTKLPRHWLWYIAQACQEFKQADIGAWPAGVKRRHEQISYTVPVLHTFAALPAIVASAVSDKELTMDKYSEIEATMENMKKQPGGVAKLITQLKSAGLAWDTQIRCGQVVVHPSNRNGSGLSVHHVREMVETLSDLGYDEALCKNICVEIPPDQLDEVLRFNKNLVAEANGSLADIEEQSVRFASISGTHTNCALRSIAAGCVHENGSLCVDGKLSLAKVREKSAELAKAVEMGQTWTVVSQQAVAKFGPALCSVLQSAANASNHIAAGESELQLARKILETYKACSGDKKEVTWSTISKQVLATKPPHAASGPWLFLFLMHFGGGLDGNLIIGTEDQGWKQPMTLHWSLQGSDQTF